ncbi:PREDICTED: uncharacterized protein LOC109233431 [Nicotiana attenuata]|uniref:Uncharacterized protein n=1 Tax=Nicotiana attenuata TaxID=49451 RepID=A0A1J6HZB5_NICAT|nr:PREDICTED: uncharacterized protein LOC109233431 [Nicotiana attenuata]OIS98164.1 hypothetical protein A4A49_08463 [Nicotiana attenuata]
MSKASEIRSLFLALASELQSTNLTTGNEAPNLDLTITNLNHSLNLSETSPGVRVLDTALSLMCFTSSQVYDCTIEYLVKTIATVLSTSIECKVLRTAQHEVLQVGGLISAQDCTRIIESCADILHKLEGCRQDLSPMILYAVVRVAVLASRVHYSLKLPPVLDLRSIDGGHSAVLKQLHCQKEFNIESGKIPLRLLSWQLDHMLLKYDVSQILQEAIKRPFLCLDMEFHQRKEWHSIVISLVLSPVMFTETRSLLHNWFLLSGLASILELHVKLVSLVLDIISRPRWWGISMDLGSKLPFSHAYFPCKNQILKILTGPLSFESLEYLVHEVYKPVNTFSNKIVNIARINHSSIWETTITFPSWFIFASILLFSKKSLWGKYSSTCIYGAGNINHSEDVKSPFLATAAKFIAWSLNPAGGSYLEHLVDYLSKFSKSWNLKFGFDEGNETTLCHKKEFRRSLSFKKEMVNIPDSNSQTLAFWLKEFQDMYIGHSDKVNENFARDEERTPGVSAQKNMLFRRIPIGILFGCLNHITDAECELLLHYSAAGTLGQFTGGQLGRKNRKSNHERQKDSIAWVETYTVKEATAGALIVFDITDVIESMTTSMFETEECGLSFVCDVKLKIGRYLFKCVKRLLQLTLEKNNIQLNVHDLHDRMLRWKHQGRDVFQTCRDLDEIFDACASASF